MSIAEKYRGTRESQNKRKLDHVERESNGRSFDGNGENEEKYNNNEGIILEGTEESFEFK
jgi:hypothetical protein